MPTALSQPNTRLIRRLLIADLRASLPGQSQDDDRLLTPLELNRVVSVASWLALSPEIEDRALAYEIATRAVTILVPPEPAMIKAAELILARLGNFPGRDLLRKRYNNQLGEIKGANLLRFEAMMRKMENTIDDAAGKPFTVTDFQYEALAVFGEFRSVSLSAPTSAGKSFILALHVIRKLKAAPGLCIVYLVPTRALIRQVIVALREELRKAELGDLPVRCIPTPITPGEAKQGIVYVLTQERLISLLHSESETGQVWINTLIVDEAQGIADGGRGVILHSAIDEVVHGFPHVEVIFACPLAKNPKYLLSLFGREQGRPFLERQSPVSQNLILVKFLSSDTASFELLRAQIPYSLGKRTLLANYTNLGALQRRARFAQEVAAKDGCCLVYADGAKDAEKLAGYLAEKSSSADTEDQEIREFIKYLSEHVHPQYGLIAVLKKRIAFHYGNMPGNVRAGVEELCKHGKLRFVCCTSTLLQGINLPARDVVIENPKRGRGQAMDRADFLNLSGRAGRLTKEFHGNVWCLRQDNWENASFKGEPLQTVQSALEVTVRDGGMALRKVLEKPDTANDEQAAVAAINRIYTDFLSNRPSIDVSSFCPPASQAKWNDTIRQVQTMETNLPARVYARNYSILPSRLEELYQYMVIHKDPRELMPIQPRRAGTNMRLYAAMQVQDQILERTDDNSFKHHYYLAKDWVHDQPLGRIIASALKYLKAKGGEVNERNAIYEVIHDIEHDIRYRYAKNFRAYNDVLAIALVDRGHADEAEHLPPFHLFLESGGSSPVFLALVSLGLSRTSALLLRNRIVFSQTVTPEHCLKSLKRIHPRLLNLPPFCLREVETITGRMP
jgi:superfamily II DNA/RNA helicase